VKPPDLRQIVKDALADRAVNWLAGASGVPQSALSKWLSGYQDSINSRFLERVFAALSITVGKRRSGRG
jgi:transposase-like protein